MSESEDAVQRSDAYRTYMSSYYAKDPQAARTHQRKLAWLQHNYASHLPKINGARCLEIGPGKGELLQWLTERSIEVHAVDLSEEIVRYCNEILPGSTELVNDTAAYLERHTAEYDVVFMLHVLEHVQKQDVIPLLRAVRAALVPGGRLIVEVPNMGNPFIGLYSRYVDFTHEVGFTAESLEFVFSAAGFTNANARAAELPQDRPYRILQHMAERLIGFVYRITGLAIGVRTPRLISHSIFAVGVR